MKNTKIETAMINTHLWHHVFQGNLHRKCLRPSSTNTARSPLVDELEINSVGEMIKACLSVPLSLSLSLSLSSVSDMNPNNKNTLAMVTNNHRQY